MTPSAGVPASTSVSAAPVVHVVRGHDSLTGPITSATFEVVKE